MDEIAAEARISKQTIYTHFASKEALFADLVMGNAARVDDFITSLVDSYRQAGSLEEGLRRLARVYAGVVMQPEVLRLRRLVIGEAGRFPDLARTYHERVPQRVYDALAGLFGDLATEGKLRLDDPVLGAHHFAWLVLGMPLDRGMFLADAEGPPHDLDRVLDAGVRVFLAAYGAG